MFGKILFFLAIIILLIIQISFLNPLSTGLTPINLILLLLPLLVFQMELAPLLWWSLVLGGIMDLIFTSLFGLETVMIISTSIFLHFLFKNFLTNRSLYTFILLTLIGTLTYNLLFYLTSFLFYSLKLIDYALLKDDFWMGLGWQALDNMIIAFFLFLLSHFINQRFRKQFLVTK